MPKQSIAIKLVGKVFNSASNKVIGKLTTKALDLVGLGKPPAPVKLQPHELQALLDEHYSEAFELNTFSGRQLYLNKPLTDVSLTSLKNELCSKFNVKLTKTDLREAVQLACHNNPVSPVRRYLEELEWDNKDRMPEVLSLLHPTNEDELSLKMLRCWLIGLVARGLQPGIKFDNVLVLVGKQRAGKSSLLRELGSPWFRDTNFDIDTRDGLQCLQAVWLYEFAELRPVLNKNPDLVKGFISSQVDTYRDPWHKHAEEHPRACVFAGTTNRDKFYDDPSGSARYFTIETGTIDLAKFATIRNQVLAQAVALHKQGVSHWLDANDTALSEERNKRFAV